MGGRPRLRALGPPLRRAAPPRDCIRCPGFKSFDERDLLGFVDGTENPEGAAALAAVVIGDEDPDFAGGSHVVVQKYLHDLAAWDAMPVEAQERIIGREKLSHIELADDVKKARLAMARSESGASRTSPMSPRPEPHRVAFRE